MCVCVWSCWLSEWNMNVTIKWTMPLECDYVLSVIECQILYPSWHHPCWVSKNIFTLFLTFFSFTVGFGKPKSTKLERNPDSATCNNRRACTHCNIGGKWMSIFYSQCYKRKWPRKYSWENDKKFKGWKIKIYYFFK